MAIEIGQDFLEKYGLSGLSSIMAAAIVKAERAGPRAKKILFQKTVEKVCQIAVEAGLKPADLLEAAMMILEISHRETARLRQESEHKKRTEAKMEEDKIRMELANEGL